MFLLNMREIHIPNEILNIILSYRPRHPIHTIMHKILEKYMSNYHYLAVSLRSVGFSYYHNLTFYDWYFERKIWY